MDHLASVEHLLISAFPQRKVVGQIAPHSCAECSGLEAQLTGITWPEIPDALLRANDDCLPLLSHEAYLEFIRK
jgi:hypothetical protein